MPDDLILDDMNQCAVLALTVLAFSIKPIKEIHYSGL